MAVLLLVSYQAGSHSSTKQFDNYCQLMGSVYVEDSPKRADFLIYEEESEAMADLIVFKPDNKLFADRPGLWYFTPNKDFADFTVYFTDHKGKANFSVYFTDLETYAGCN